MFTTRPTRISSVVIEVSDWTIINTFAHRVSAAVSVGENFQLPTTPALQAEAGLWQMRAAELNAARGLPMSGKGTTSVVRVQNINTSESMTWIATESKSMPRAFEGLLRPGEVYVEVPGHAEQSIIRALGGEWQAMAGGTSRNVCLGTCQPLLEQHGLTLGGPVFGGAVDKTAFRMFWRPQ